MKRKFLLFFLSIVITCSAQAQTWDGSAGTDWNTAANWSTNAVPVATGNVIIPGSLTNYPVLASNVTINTIDLQQGSSLDFNGFSLTMITPASGYTNFIGTVLNNSNAVTDIVINISMAPGYHTYVRGTTVNDNITFNLSGPAGFYEADNGGSGNHYLGDLNINFDASGILYLSSGDTSLYDENLVVSRTGAGTTDAFNGGAIIGGNFSFTNNTAGASYFGISSQRTSIGGTVNIAVNDTTPGSFEMIRLINQTAGGSINVQNSRGFDVRNDTLIVNTLSITGYTGADYGYLYNNDITGDVTLADDVTHIAGYHTYMRENEITGNAAFTSNAPTNFYDADASGTGNHYTGDVNFSIAGTGGLYLSSGDTSLYDGNLIINRTGAGTTDAFNGGAIIGGNFSFTNNTAGASYFGISSQRTSIGGTVNIAVNDTTPGSFEMIRLINQTGGGSINVQNSRGFDVRNDTLIVNTLSITGYTGADYGYLYNNDITGDVTLADDVTHIAGYHTYMRENEITGNAAFTSNAPTNFYDADASGTGNHYTGDVNFSIAGTGGLYLSSGDTSLYDGNLIINRTGAGTTDAFNSGAIIGGNFSFTNNTAGVSLFGIGIRRTTIGGTVNISVSDTTPGSFELLRLINQTGGGSINVQNTRGFDVRNDTLLVSTLSITGYRGADYGYLYNNDITGDVMIADDVTHIAGYHTYIRSNVITGNSSFTNNGPANFYDADNTGAGNKYIGDVSFARNGGLITIGISDTTEISGSLTLNSSAAITLGDIKFNGATNGAIEEIGTLPVIIDQIIMEKTGAGKITLNDSVTVSTELIFNGGNIENTPASPLIFPDNAINTGASDASHVNGLVKKAGNDAFTFPVGSATSLNSVAMTAPAAGSDFTAQYFFTNPDAVGDTSLHAPSFQRISGCEYWDVQRVTGTSNVTLTFEYGNPCAGAGSIYITNPASVGIAHWNGATWEDLGNGGSTGTTSGTITTAAPVSNFSPFTFGSADTVVNPLPLRLISFNAKKAANHVLLSWQTENELNSAYFDIEKSIIGLGFNKINNVTAKNRSGKNDYSSVDLTPAEGMNAYRLKSVDADGRFTYSDIITAYFTKSFSVIISPNPTRDVLVIKDAMNFTMAQVIDASGRVLISKKINGTNQQVSTGSLSAGKYLLRLSGGSETHTIPFIRQ